MVRLRVQVVGASDSNSPAARYLLLIVEPDASFQRVWDLVEERFGVNYSEGQKG